MYLLFATISPVFILFLGFSFPLKLVYDFLVTRLNFHPTRSRYEFNYQNKLQFRSKLLLLGLIILFNILFSFVPHLDANYSGLVDIGADTRDYVIFLSNMEGSDSLNDLLWEAFIVQSSGDRAISLMFFYFVTQVIAPLETAVSVDYLPLILGPILIISIYFLTVTLSGNDKIAILSSLITSVSFHVLVGIYGGLYANWFSLVFGYGVFTFLIKSIHNPTRKNLVLFSLLFVCLIFSHAPSWAIILIIVISFLLILLILRPYSRKIMIALFVLTLPSIIIDISRNMFLNASGFVQDFTYAQSQGIGLHNLSALWSNLVETSHTFMGGLLGNPVILVLVIYWVLCSKLRDTTTILFMIFFTASLFPIFLGGSDIQSRAIYEIPFQIPAAIALLHLHRRFGLVVSSTIILSLIAISLRNILNLIFVSNA
jgi:hypothetical protein